MRPFMKSTGRGAVTSIYVASAPNLEEVTGRYFASSRPKRSSKLSYRQADGERLWAVSTELVGHRPWMRTVAWDEPARSVVSLLPMHGRSGQERPFPRSGKGLCFSYCQRAFTIAKRVRW